MIPLLLSLSLAAGVYLTFEGCVRPRPPTVRASRGHAAREFLLRAGLRDVTPHDFVLFSLASGTVAGIAAQVCMGWVLLSGVCGLVGLLGPYVYYVRRHDRRRAAIQDGLVDAIEQLRDAIRT